MWRWVPVAGGCEQRPERAGGVAVPSICSPEARVTERETEAQRGHRASGARTPPGEQLSLCVPHRGRNRRIVAVLTGVSGQTSRCCSGSPPGSRVPTWGGRGRAGPCPVFEEAVLGIGHVAQSRLPSRPLPGTKESKHAKQDGMESEKLQHRELVGPRPPGQRHRAPHMAQGRRPTQAARRAAPCGPPTVCTPRGSRHPAPTRPRLPADPSPGEGGRPEGRSVVWSAEPHGGAGQPPAAQESPRATSGQGYFRPPAHFSS